MLRRLTIPLAPLMVLALFSIAATAQETATQIAAAILVVAPLVLPLVLKYVPLVGTKMTLFTYAISLVVAVIAGFSAGLIKATDFSSAPGLIAAGTAVFGLTQLVFGILKNSGRFAKLVR